MKLEITPEVVTSAKSGDTIEFARTLAYAIVAQAGAKEAEQAAATAEDAVTTEHLDAYFFSVNKQGNYPSQVGSKAAAHNDIRANVALARGPLLKRIAELEKALNDAIEHAAVECEAKFMARKRVEAAERERAEARMDLAETRLALAKRMHHEGKCPAAIRGALKGFDAPKVEREVKDRPIIFSSESVRAILDGRKTQTRRLMVPQPSAGVRRSPFAGSGIEDGHGLPIKLKYGGVGDRLWVRETIRVSANGAWSEYVADGKKTKADCWPWRTLVMSSIHCPRCLSRITLEIVEVRVQRLQDITEEDAKAEGVDGHVGGQGPVSRFELQTEPGFWHPRFYRDGFEWSWSKSHDKPSEFGASWASNPWVWGITFKRIRP